MANDIRLACMPNTDASKDEFLFISVIKPTKRRDRLEKIYLPYSVTKIILFCESATIYVKFFEIFSKNFLNRGF